MGRCIPCQCQPTKATVGLLPQIWQAACPHLHGCVYDQNNAPQNEESFTSSHCRYVVSKLAAEYECSPRDLILRPRLYFSDLPDKNNLLSKLPNFSHHLNEINSFTSTATIVEATTALLNAEQCGIFNVAQRGYGTVQQIAKHLGIGAKPPMTGEQLQHSQGLALVNNILDISKLEQFYHLVSYFTRWSGAGKTSALDPNSLICYH